VSAFAFSLKLDSFGREFANFRTFWTGTLHERGTNSAYGKDMRRDLIRCDDIHTDWRDCRGYGADPYVPACTLFNLVWVKPTSIPSDESQAVLVRA
jgi:hypothetical protein